VGGGKIGVLGLLDRALEDIEQANILLLPFDPIDLVIQFAGVAPLELIDPGNAELAEIFDSGRADRAEVSQAASVFCLHVLTS